MPTGAQWCLLYKRLHNLLKLQALDPGCYSGLLISRNITLATPNYGYEKRQRELAKKKKKEDKARAKAAPVQHASVYVAPEPGYAPPASPTDSGGPSGTPSS